ncbi:MAG: DUF1566 domain-containing protein [Terracidiphilus sp.]
MPIIKHNTRKTLVLLCIVACGAQFSLAETVTPPKTWWPDPKTGLMWTGQTPQKRGIGNPTMNWEDANGYCASLKIGDVSGWRLPTLNELMAITEYRQVSGIPEPYITLKCCHDNLSYTEWESTMEANARPAHKTLAFKGGISVTFPLSIWSSTRVGDKQAYVVTPSGNWGDKYDYFARGGKVLPVNMAQDHANLLGLHASPTYVSALCTRPMEAEILQIARDAQANRPVPDLLTLKAYIPLAKARLKYRTRRYRESIKQARNALLIKPDFAPAFWAIGISYGRLGQWNLAITNLETALKIDKGFDDAKDSLKWAKKGQKAAKSGDILSAQSPQWN